MLLVLAIRTIWFLFRISASLNKVGLKSKICFIFFYRVYMCMCMFMQVSVEAREGVRILGAGVAGGYKLPGVSAHPLLECYMLSTAGPPV